MLSFLPWPQISDAPGESSHKWLAYILQPSAKCMVLSWEGAFFSTSFSALCRDCDMQTYINLGALLCSFT